MSFKNAFDSGKFVVTAEVGPPKGTDIKEMLHHAEMLKGKLDAVNVTDNQSAVMRICSMAICKLLLDMGLEPILQMTCRDRNRIGLQSDLLGASVLGIKNVLCMTGAKFFQTQAIYDIEKFKEFMKFAKKFPVKILAGIVLLKSAGMANYMNKFVPGIRVPQDLIDEIKAAGKEGALDTGINIAARHIKQLKEEKICDGVHIMAIGAEDKVPAIMERAGLL
ncbi:MAG: methylenetetrahydrofolate reductase [Nitrospirae bacterium]|nr:methylenetetrahydrofolate reductase [Nitrospirota bacterium]